MRRDARPILNPMGVATSQHVVMHQDLTRGGFATGERSPLLKRRRATERDDTHSHLIITRSTSAPLAAAGSASDRRGGRAKGDVARREFWNKFVGREYKKLRG